MDDASRAEHGPSEPTGIEIRRVVDATELAASAPAWDRLAVSHRDPLPFNTYAWFSAFVDHRLRPSESWVCLQAWRQDVLVGVLPLARRRGRHFGVPGTVLSTPFDDHTQFSHLLVAPNHEAEVVPALVAAAVSLNHDVLVVDLQGLRAESAMPFAMTGSRARWRTLRTPVGAGAYLPIGSDFAAYRASLSRRFRSNLNRATHKLVLHSDVAFERTRAGDAAASDLDEFLAVEAASWKGAAGTAIRCDPELVRFYATLAQRLASAGWLEWHSLRVEGRAIASVLVVAMGRRVFLVKIGVDAAYPELSPGILLVERVIQRAFEEGLREVDFLTDPAWIQPWGLERRECQYVRLYPTSLRATLAAYAPQRLTRFVKGLPGVQPLGRAVRDAVRRQRSKGSVRS